MSRKLSAVGFAIFIAFMGMSAADAQTPTGSISLSPFEGWNVSLSSPVIWGGLSSVNLGVSANRSFPIGRSLEAL